MKILNYLTIIFFLFLGGFIIVNLLKEEKAFVKTKYIVGEETIFRDTIYIEDKSQYTEIAKVDSIKTDSTNYEIYSTKFNLGTDTLGVKGEVTLSTEHDIFLFDSIEYRYPKTIINRVDTLEFIQSIDKPFHQDPWFYTTIGASGILLLILL